jgi:hypothetical protein
VNNENEQSRAGGPRELLEKTIAEILRRHCNLGSANYFSFLCHPERSRGTPDPLRRRKMHANHASSDELWRAHFDRSVVGVELARIQKDPGSLGYARDDTKNERYKERTTQNEQWRSHKPVDIGGGAGNVHLDSLGEAGEKPALPRNCKMSITILVESGDRANR